jgi:glycosyltransferase involved in cell wall biosynthesis
MAKKVSNNSLPKISIVMPVFNGESYIKQAIDSILTQDYPNFELYIKDGGSKDSTIKILKEYAKKYPLKIKWISKKDQGQTDAINYGLNQIDGEVIAYLNADDVYKPGTFKIVGEYFMNNPRKLWLIGKCDIINNQNKEIRKLITFYKNFWLGIFSYNVLLVLNFISQMAVFWRKEAFEKVGNFDASQYYVMDYDYWLRLGKVGNPGIIDKYLASFRVINSSKSSTGFIKQFADEYKVAGKYTKNKLLLNLHLIHTRIITSVYRILS